MELRGAPVARAITEGLQNDIEKLKTRGVTPCLAVVRVGARGDDLSYEKGIAKRFAEAGCEVKSVPLAEDCAQNELEAAMLNLNGDKTVHGILVLRPLPKAIDAARVASLVSPEKDVDGMNALSLGRVLMGDENAFAPCTAKAVIEVLDHYGIPLAGKRVTLVGRSAVVGKPLLALLVARDATVTVCHTKTVDLTAECRRADILVACAGKAGLITKGHIGENCVVIDVGVNVVEEKLMGDVSPDAYEIAKSYTPVPGGVGAVTNAVLLSHTVRAAVLVQGRVR